MNEASQWRIEVARCVVAAYAGTPTLEAAVAVGSLARGTADSFSDIDLILFWRAFPANDERWAAIERLNGLAAHLENTQPGVEGSDTFYLSGDADTGLKIELAHTLTTAMQRQIDDVTERHDMDAEKLLTLYFLGRAYALHGLPLIEEWQIQIGRCPLHIAHQVVADNLKLFPSWTLTMLHRRGDWLYYNDIVGTILHRLMMVLVGLNRLYPPKKFKHLALLIDDMQIVPPRLLPAITRILRQHRFADIVPLAEAIYDLVDQHMPDIDTTAARDWLRYRRAEWHEPPEL